MKTNKNIVVHVIYSLTTGGLENGLVNLINNLPDSCCRHIIICLKNATNFKDRINKSNVSIYELNKRDGNDVITLFRLWKIFLKIRPNIVHTRNIGTIDCVLPAFFAGVPIRLHGEHGRDMQDIDGNNRKYKYVRKLYQPFITKFITMSKDLSKWLLEDVKIPSSKIEQIYNGVDTNKFLFKEQDSSTLDFNKRRIVFGTVGQLRPEKDQLTLVKAVNLLLTRYPDLRDKVRLSIVGDGPNNSEIVEYIHKHDLSDLVWMAGSRNDIDIILRDFDVFILPSLGEGISNTILEAMSIGLPIVATNVGGNPELVVEGVTGKLVEPASSISIMETLYYYINNPSDVQQHGIAARKRVMDKFSLDRMINNYYQIYSSYSK